jgi:hypothetical protein
MNGTIKKLAEPVQGLRLRNLVAMGFVSTVLVMNALPAQADNLVVNGSFEINGGSGQIGYNTTLADWSVPTPNGSYAFVYAPGSADVPGAVLSNYGENALWGPNDGSNNGLSAMSPDGGYYVALDGDFQISALSQTINGLTPGDSYTVGFWWAASQQYGFYGTTLQAMNVCLGNNVESYVDPGTQPLSGGANASSNLNCDGSSGSTAVYTLPSNGFSGWQYQTFDLTANNTSDVLSFLAYGNVQLPPFALLDGVTLNADNSPVPEPGSLPLLFTGLMGGLAILRSKKWLRR